MMPQPLQPTCRAVVSAMLFACIPHRSIQVGTTSLQKRRWWMLIKFLPGAVIVSALPQPGTHQYTHHYARTWTTTQILATAVIGTTDPISAKMMGKAWPCRCRTRQRQPTYIAAATALHMHHYYHESADKGSVLGPADDTQGFGDHVQRGHPEAVCTQPIVDKLRVAARRGPPPQ